MVVPSTRGSAYMRNSVSVIPYWAREIRKIRNSIRNTEYGIRNTEYGIRNTEYGMRNTKYGIRNTHLSSQCLAY